MKTEWMEAFLVTAETGSLTKASEVLHMTQPALSKQIKSLESALDVSLLHRSAHGVTLTQCCLTRRSSPCPSVSYDAFVYGELFTLRASRR